MAGCQLWVSADTPQCEANRDCVALFGNEYVCSRDEVCVIEGISVPDAGVPADASVFQRRWKCVRAATRIVTPEADKRVTISFSILNFSTNSVPEGLTARACNPADIACENPVVADVTPGPAGKLAFELPHGFSGFFEITAPGIVSTLLYSNKPYTEDVSFAGPSVVTPAVMADIATRGDDATDFTLGLAIIETFDCDSNPADGVHLEIKDNSGDHAFYFVGALPDRDLESTKLSTAMGYGRDVRAVGGFNNITTGYTTFKATLVDTGNPVGDVTAQVRSSYMTYIHIYAGY